ncbi:MAG TPA: gephyrin-like molybdotransferase Glp [Pseudonocardiaceae bacterium]|nr:gephyrin-like molybdotransferase Glp [Pseudonocardiaceae bacterium]
MSSPHGLVPVEEHQATVAELIGTLPVVALPVADCLGLVVAHELRSPIPLPPFDNSAMDGYAVLAADLAGATADRPVELPVVEDIPAGRTDVVPLVPGTVHRIMTGAPMPPGADAVVPVEQTDAGTSRVRVHGEVAPGTHVRRVGEDVAVGAVVLAAGTVLGPVQLGLAAAVGAGSLPVYRRPRVLVLSTGSELVEPGKPLLRGQIYESNGIMLAAAVRSLGGEPELLRFVPDDVESFHGALAGRLGGADLVITSGGVSAGAYEVVKDALTGQGVTFYKVAMQPGGPQGAGRYRGVPVVTLPGNPVSAAISFEIFVRPALLAAGGHAPVQRPRPRATLLADVTAPAGRRQYRRGRYVAASGQVSPVGGPGSHLLASLSAANCLFVVPEEATMIAAGTQVEVIPLQSLAG